MPQLADIFRRYGAAYLEKFAQRMLPSHIRALHDIANCRSGEFGAHIDRCDQCGYTHRFYHSCCNRSCPQCHTSHTKSWIEKTKQLLLPVHYFHVVFTLPEELRLLVRGNQSKLYNCLIQAAAYTLLKLMAQQCFAKGKPGMISVLHTWTRTMLYHPHVHFLIAGAVISNDSSQWILLDEDYLLPFQVMSSIFRARFMKLARKALPGTQFPHSVWQKQWVVYTKPLINGGKKVLEYLARYVHRIAITNNRILADHDAMITFKYQDNKTGQWKKMTLRALEFIRRFLQHVLPKGFHKIRYHGFLAPKNRQLFYSLKLTLTNHIKIADYSNDNNQNQLHSGYRKCPRCKTGNMVVMVHIFFSKKLTILVRPPP